MRSVLRLLGSIARLAPIVVAASLSASALAATKMWTSTADVNWGTAGNWTPPTANANDDLVFPSTTSQKLSNNDIFNRTFNSLAFQGGGYSIFGTSISLVAGISANFASGSFAFAPPITLLADQSFNNVGAASYALNGAINLNGRSLSLGGNGDVVINGNITGTGTISKNGTGKATVTGSVAGSTVVNNGTYQYDGTTSGPLSLAGGTLAGSGTVGSISVAAGVAKVIAPGSGGTTTAELKVTGGVPLNSTVTLQIDLNGTTPGTQHDQLTAGSISLSGATLALSVGFMPAAETQFTIVSGALTGQFAQGSSITAGGIPFSIVYTPNSVVLKALASTRTWSGAADDKWSNAANWVGNAAPIPGDSLVFPESALRKSNINDYAADTKFGSISFPGTGYIIGGNAIQLSGGLSVSVSGAGRPQINVNITLTQAQVFDSGVNGQFQISGAINLNGFVLTLTGLQPGNGISGAIQGAGELIKSGSGIVGLSGNNSYSGVTRITGGVLAIFHNNALGATGPGNHTIVANNFAMLRLLSDNLSISEELVLNGLGQLNPGALAASCSTGCSVNGPITLASTSVGIGVPSGTKLTLGGPIGESGGARQLQLLGNGTLTLTNASSYTGGTEVAGGTLIVSGSIGNVVFSGPGGTLSGAGTVGTITVLAGTGTHVVAPGINAGVLRANVNVAFVPNTRLRIELGGPGVGTQHDQLSVSGAVNLGNAALDISLINGFVPVAGAQFTIVTGAITGQFAQGNVVTVAGRAFNVAYNPASVVLTVMPSTRTWSGTGANNNWTTAANWVGSFAPLPGDSLVFPEVANQKASNNDFPAGTAFGSVTVGSDAYEFSGNLIILGGGVLFNAPGSGLQPSFVLPLQLSAAQSVVNDGGGLANLGPVNLGGFPLTVSGTNSISIKGAVTGAGGIVKTGTGSLLLRGSGNTYTGTTQVVAGTVFLDRDGAAGSAAVGNGTIVANGAILEAGVSTSHSEPLTLNGGSILRAGTCVTGCVMAGPITLAGNSTVGTRVFKAILTLGPIGEVSGAQTLGIEGPFTAILAGTNSYTGGTVLTGSATKLLVNGVTGSVSLAGGTLGGTGTVGNLTGPGTVAPGASAGILNVAGNVTFTNSNTLAIEIGGTTAGTQYDRLNVTGTVALGAATLQGALLNAFTPAPGDSFTIVQSDGAVTGTFAQGTSVTINGVAFDIAYNAKSVVLTAAAAPALPDLTITKTHSGTFAPGQVGATYTALVTNSGAGAKPDAALVSVVDSPPTGLTITAMSGSGWTCTTLPTCTRSDLLSGFQSYPPISISVTVAGNATSPQVNTIAVSTGATEASTSNNSASDSTVIGTSSLLSITKAGSGSGTVTSQDGGIDCGATCSNVYVNGSNITLTATPAAGSVFTGWLGRCTGTGTCVVSISGSAATVSATFAPSSIGTRILDIDGDTKVNALTDGLLAIRYLFGLTGATLTGGAIGTGATRADSASVIAYLLDVFPRLDVDGNGEVNALSDGLLILRELFGVTGAQLVQGAIGPNATRTTEAAILAYLATLKQ